MTVISGLIGDLHEQSVVPISGLVDSLILSKPADKRRKKGKDVRTHK
jgi:hypothetical protein